MAGASAYAIVCTGGGPRASAALRSRFASAQFRYVGPSAAAPFGVAADTSLAAALRSVDAAITIVVDPTAALDHAAAAALAEAAAVSETLVVPAASFAAGGRCFAGRTAILRRIVANDAAGGRLDLAAAGAAPWWSDFAAAASQGRVMRTLRAAYGEDIEVADPLPRSAAVVLGRPADPAAFERALRACALGFDEIVHADGAEAQARAQAVLRNRGDRYVAFVDAASVLPRGWFDALVAALEHDPLAAFATFAPRGLDARATVVAASRIPECDRLEPFETLHGALADLALRVGRERGRGVVRVAEPLALLPPAPEDAAFRARHGCGPAEAEISLVPAAPRFSGIASIIMLSWNAPEFTRMAVESIRAVTRYPHEIIVVDNGSDVPTLAILAELEAEHGVRVVYNGRNLGFGAGMNVGMAHARGDVLVILNNDVIVTAGWLEDLVGALERRRSVGCSAPRSNRVASAAQVEPQYVDTAGMHRWAAERRRGLAGRGHLADRVVGFCMCLDRKVIDGIGGFDPRYGMGNFEDDDLSVRIRGAGWQMFVCDDVFIHHFGSVSFKANAVDYRDLMETNWRAFCAKWGLGDVPLYTPYDPRVPARGGFDREAHYISLPVPA
jgi:GT2 family glycosyltransferase